MASDIRDDGASVTVVTDGGHRIIFARTELGGPSVDGNIVTDWAGGVPPSNPELVVRSAKAEAERHVAQTEAPPAQR